MGFIWNYEVLKYDVFQLHNFYSQWGDVVDCIVIRDPQTKCSRGFGFVTFASVHMAEAAMANKPHIINGKVSILSVMKIILSLVFDIFLFFVFIAFCLQII